MTHENIPRICSVEDFHDASPRERLELALAQVRLTPDHWDQGDWIELTDESASLVYDWERRSFLGEVTPRPALCGTAFCLAGFAVFLADDKIVSRSEVVPRGGRGAVHVRQRANELFGLRPDHDVGEFHPFSESNTLEDLEFYVRWLVAHPDVTEIPDDLVPPSVAAYLDDTEEPA